MTRANVRIAIQKSGRLRVDSENFLKKWGINYKPNDGNALIVPSDNNKFEILFARYGDIAQYVANGAADFGIIGENVLQEKKLNIKAIKKLGFGKCRLVIAVPKGSSIKTVSDLEGERIATSYPVSLRKFLKEINCGATIIKTEGGVEASPRLGIADAICDITQTGKTLASHNLKIISEVLNSEAVVIASPFMAKPAEEFMQKILEK